jgi:hypothetical protein
MAEQIPSPIAGTAGSGGAGITVRPTITTVVRDYLPALGALGLILYGLLRIAYVFFYLRLRTTPEEVGYDYGRILSESIAGAVELVILCAAVFALVNVLLYVTRLLPLLWSPNRASSVREFVNRRPRLLVRRIALRSLALGAVFVLASLPILAWWQGGLAQGGQTVRNVYFIGVPYLPVLAVQAVPADVAWVGGDADTSVQLAGRECLMYLGQANGSSVFFDVQSRESLRLPSGSIAVSLKFTFFVPDDCRASP